MRQTDIPAGTLHTLHVDSQAVAGNMLGDSPHRRIDVYVPVSYTHLTLPTKA